MNNYHIYEPIGKGVHSVVYKGRRKQTIEYYAIKSVQKSQKQRVHQEVKTIHDLRHPNILRFYNWYETGNHLWLILEYCVGGDLKSLLHHDVKLPESSVHDFGRDLLAALQYLHSRSTIHCDLKPSNILLDEDGSIKLGGFSVSRKLSDISQTPLHNLQVASRGTPCYMAPELFQDGAAHSTASDLWAVGCVLYECYVGRPPFMNTSFNQLVQNILHSEYAPMSNVSPEFADLVKRLLDKNPATRMTWVEMLTHPFWQFTMAPVQMPQEPALERFIKMNNLAPALEEQETQCPAGASDAGERAKMVRASVNITRLSQIVRGNLEKDYQDHSDINSNARVKTGMDINLENPDAELDFEVHQNEDGSQNLEDAMHRLATDGDRASDSERTGVSDTDSNAPSNKQGTTQQQGSDVQQAAASSDVTVMRGGPEDTGPSQSIRPGTIPQAVESDQEDAPLMSIDQLIFHNTDLAVKPLVGNRRIERLAEVKWDELTLPSQLPVWDLPALLEAVRNPQLKAEFTDFVSKISAALSGSANHTVKVNLLAYFESLCADGVAATSLINTNLTTTLIRLFGNTRNSSLKVRIASVLGLLIRHAAFIDFSLASSGIVDTLRDSLRDNSEKVRRRVMATLGELLFYVATIESDAVRDGSEEQPRVWHVSQSTAPAIVYLLRSGEDELVQHYAAKAIDNIATQLGSWPKRFATEDTVKSLLQLMRSGRSDLLKATAGSALGRLLRNFPELLPLVISQGGLQLCRDGISHAAVRIQVVCLNLFNLILFQPDLQDNAKSLLQQDRMIMSNVISLLDHTYVLVRAKGLLAAALICRLHPSWLLEACQLELPLKFSRLQADKSDEYVQRCLVALRHSVVEVVPTVFREVRAGLNGPQQQAGVTSSLALFDIILHLSTSPIFRAKVISPALVLELSDFVTASWICTQQTAASAPEFRVSLMHVLEALCQPPDLLVIYCQSITESLLPALCKVTQALLATQATEVDKDLRVNSSRMMADILMFFLNHQDLYCGSRKSASTPASASDMTRKIDNCIKSHVLPLLPSMMAERDPMPLYAQKILATLLPRNPVYVADVEDLSLNTRFFQFLSIDSPNNNIHNIRVCRMIVSQGNVTAHQLRTLCASHKVSHVLEYAHAHQVEPFLEPTVELCFSLLQRDSVDVPRNVHGAGDTIQLVRNIVSFIIFAGTGEITFALTAARCAALIAELYPRESAELVLSDEGTEATLLTLTGEGDEGPPAGDVSRELLSMLNKCKQIQPSTATQGLQMRLREVLSHIQDTSSEALAGLASRALRVA